MVTPKLPALRAYQHLLPRPLGKKSPNDDDAIRGRVVFNANCATCHVNGSLTDNNAGVLHSPSETGMDPTYAARTTTKQYRTTPLRGLWLHPPYFHDGSAKTLEDVVNHYNTVRRLGLTDKQKKDLVDYLQTL